MGLVRSWASASAKPFFTLCSNMKSKKRFLVATNSATGSEVVPGIDLQNESEPMGL